MHIVSDTMMASLEKRKRNRCEPNASAAIITIADNVWNLCLDPQSRELNFFSQYYAARTATIDTGLFKPSNNGDIIDIVQILKTNPDKPLGSLQSLLLNLDPRPAWLVASTEQAAHAAIQFGSSFWLMLSTTDWQRGETLLHFLDRIKIELQGPVARLAKTTELRFSARGINQIAGIEILWTSDLRDHLRYDPVQRTVSIFRHASFLQGRNEAGHAPDFLMETAQTLALLFPYGESPHRSWNRRVRKMAQPDVEVGLSSNPIRDSTYYKYWSDRLIVLQDAFDTSKPQRLTQWYHDKRDSNQFYTFWFAVVAITLALIFGLVQSITGILQVYLAARAK